MNILITGVAGFIGSKLAENLLQNKKNKIYGIDNLDDYYSPKLKKFRINILKKKKNFKFYKIDLINYKNLEKKNFTNIDTVFHFAAQAGVRYTLNYPEKYFQNNIKVFINILEFIKKNNIKKLFFASSSSIYGDQNHYPLSEIVNPKEKNIYGLSKKINEIMARTYTKIFNFQAIGLRFFTVFGEWGRPDMLIFKYLKSNLERKIFYLNDGGKHYRDFTYIDDVICILSKMVYLKYKKNYEIFNICSNNPIKVINVINKINSKNLKFKYKILRSKILDKIEAKKTHGNNIKILSIIKKFNFTKFDTALEKTIDWYLENKIHKIT